jgi:hypothetical protein
VGIGLAGGGAALRPVVFVAILAAALVLRLVLELVTYPLGAASVWSPPASGAAQETAGP